MGWERSYLGYPISDEMNWGGSGGRMSKFQGGVIVWDSAHGARDMTTAANSGKN
jgi:uncharacterized protein with LGFP repeats